MKSILLETKHYQKKVVTYYDRYRLGLTNIPRYTQNLK